MNNIVVFSSLGLGLIISVIFIVLGVFLKKGDEDTIFNRNMRTLKYVLSFSGILLLVNALIILYLTRN